MRDQKAINEKISEGVKRAIREGRFNGGGMPEGFRHSEETRTKISESLKKTHSTTPFAEWSKGKKIRHFFNKLGNVCNCCGYEYTDPNSGKGPFELHHKDGNNCNWDENNVEVLCLNCHWKTPNWRFRGKKHSKKARKRISEGAKKAP